MAMLSEREVLERLDVLGVDIPPSRFAKWRERGIFQPTDKRPGLGRGRGRAALFYPEITVEQVRQIAIWRKQNLDLDEIGWRIWLAGYEVEQRCWFDVFKFMARQFDKCASAFRTAQASDEFVDGQMERMIEGTFKAKTSNRFFKQIKKSLGPVRFAVVMNEVASMATGTFHSISSQPELNNKERVNDERAMDVALGLEHARTDTVDGVGPRIAGDISPILQATFEPPEGIALTNYLNAIDPEYLRRVAVSLTGLLKSIGEASPTFDRVFANDAFGLRRAAMLNRVDRNIHAGMILVWALVQQRSRERFHDLDAIAKRFLTAAIGARTFLEVGKFDLGGPRPGFRRLAPKMRIKKSDE